MGRELWQHDDTELLYALRELEMRMRRDHAQVLDLIAELNTRNTAATHGYTGLVELLRDMLRITRTEATRRIRHTHALTEVMTHPALWCNHPLPQTAAAVRAGDLGAEHIDTIAKMLTDLPATVTIEDRQFAERVLVEAAASMDARTLVKIGRELRARLDQNGRPPSEAELINPINELHLTTTANGRTIGRFELDHEASALLRTILSPLAKPQPRSEEGTDPRTPPNATAMRWWRSCSWPQTAAASPPKPARNPTCWSPCPYKPYATESAPRYWTARATWTPPRHGESPVIASSSPLCWVPILSPWTSVGSAYTVPVAIRRALIIRDRGCAFPGCDRPHRWCQAHHITSWCDGGPLTWPT
jgi:hypothetical protein